MVNFFVQSTSIWVSQGAHCSPH